MSPMPSSSSEAPTGGTLFLLANSPHTRTDRHAILAAAAQGDTVLLHQDGVLALLPRVSLLDELESRGVSVRACAPDCCARGLPMPADAVDWEGFLGLITAHDRVVG